MNTKRITVLLFIALIVLMLVIFPNASVAVSMSKPNPNQMSVGWQETCTWLRESTESPSNYYDLNAKPSYGVMSWWDYGYWITRDGQRPAMCNPGSNIRYEVARYFLSPDYKEVHDALVEKHIRYVIIDYLMVTNKFYAIDTLAHAPAGQQYLPTRYQQDYLYYEEGQSKPVMLNFEEYYRSLAVRLYNFDGKAVRSPGTPVFAVDKDRTITGLQDFATLQEAQDYMAKNGGFIAGSDPFLSPYPMNDTLDGYKLVWQSNSKVKMLNWVYPEVKVFEVIY